MLEYIIERTNIGLKSKGIDAQSGALILLKEDYLDVLNQMNSIHESKYNAERYEVLSRRGIWISQDDDTVRIAHTAYKWAMEGIEYLCKVPESKYKWMNFIRLDFKNAYSPIPTVDDICKTLPVRSVAPC